MFMSMISDIRNRFSTFEPNTDPFIILCLLISINYLGELFPCKVQQLFSQSMVVKHILGWLSLMFFVVLTLPELYTSVNFIYVSISLYGFFLLLSKLNHIIWFTVFGIFAISYVLHIYVNQIENENQINANLIGDNTVNPNTNDKIPTQDIAANIEQTKTIQKYLFISIIPISIFGFILYLGEKKMEYKDKFTYFTFLFGKPKCMNTPHERATVLKRLRYAFN